MRSVLAAAACGIASAWHPEWETKPSWYESVKNGHSEHALASTQNEGEQFPLDPSKLHIDNYNWAESTQRAQIDTTMGSVMFRKYIAQEVFASQLGEYLGVCVSRGRHLEWGSKESHAWQDKLEDVSNSIGGADVAKVQYLFEDQQGLQEIEFIDGAIVEGYQARNGYEDIMYDIGKLFAFDMFINDPHNCRFCECQDNCECQGHMWTCKDGDNFNFIISPKHGVCGHTRAYSRLDITSGQGMKFRQFFQLAHTTQTTTELSKQLAYVVGEMFGENLSMDRREAAEWMLKGARFMLGRLMELNQAVFHDLAKTSGLGQAYEFGLGERLRMVRIIIGEDQQSPNVVPAAPEVPEEVQGQSDEQVAEQVAEEVAAEEEAAKEETAEDDAEDDPEEDEEEALEDDDDDEEEEEFVEMGAKKMPKNTLNPM